MAKSKSIFKCKECHQKYQKWSGKCDNCGAWDSFEEIDASQGPKAVSLGVQSGRKLTLGDLSTKDTPLSRTQLSISELDRVLGGGLVPASAILVGGDPGIGKSTLLLQSAAAHALSGEKTIYISGEEAEAQIRMRAHRLQLDHAPLLLASASNLRDILTTLEAEKPHLVIIDSIQTIWSDKIDSAPGSVSQVRSVAHELVNFAKRFNSSVMLVGHVTKEGQIAGPRVVEHMVDTVLYFEGDRHNQFRLLRAVKNRFGPADEIGVFEMTGQGLAEVPNPSALFLSERGENLTGSVVFSGIEGSRPLLVEVQALVVESHLATPRRAVVGWETSRLSMILAVLEAHAGFSFGGKDVFLNIAGGIKLSEPAADLAIATALLSALLGKAIPSQAVAFGEIALSGRIRAVSQPELRLKEAEKLGFTSAFIPTKTKYHKENQINLLEFDDLNAFVLNLFASEENSV